MMMSPSNRLRLTALVAWCSIATATVASAQPQLVARIVSGFNEPTGMDIDAQGNLYVSDRNNHRIQKFDADGNFLLEWGRLTTLPGPFDVAVDDNRNLLYVGYSADPTIKIFDTSGRPLSEWNVGGFPYLAADADGNIFVRTGAVRKFDPTGTELTAWTPSTSSAGHGIAVGDDGTLYLVDSNLCGVAKYDSMGTQLDIWSTLCTPFDVDVDAQGNVYVVEGGYMGPARAAVFTPDGTLISRWGEGLFDDPRGIAINRSTGDIYISDIGKSTVFKFVFTPVAVDKTSWSLVKTHYRE